MSWRPELDLASMSDTDTIISIVLGAGAVAAILALVAYQVRRPRK